MYTGQPRSEYPTRVDNVCLHDNSFERNGARNITAITIRGSHRHRSPIVQIDAYVRANPPERIRAFSSLVRRLNPTSFRGHTLIRRGLWTRIFHGRSSSDARTLFAASKCVSVGMFRLNCYTTTQPPIQVQERISGEGVMKRSPPLPPHHELISYSNIL